MSEIGAYVRVSTEQQLDEDSHVGQREEIAEWCGRNGHDPGGWDEFHEFGDGGVESWTSIDGEQTGDVTWFEDLAISGQSDERAAYDRLMDAYEVFDVVLVRELARFGRDPMTVLGDVEEIFESETEFVSVTEDFDTSSAMGKAFIRLVAVINGMYADLRREQAIKAAERRKEKGLPVGRPKKVDDDVLDEVYELREMGVSYADIARIVESRPDGPESISRDTIRRYCVDADVEPAERS